MVASTVSSKMIEAMAQYEGFKFVDCLTGELCSADEIIYDWSLYLRRV